jgi:hypothetical protein
MAMTSLPAQNFVNVELKIMSEVLKSDHPKVSASRWKTILILGQQKSEERMKWF